jgi:hypothetical protein
MREKLLPWLKKPAEPPLLSGKPSSLLLPFVLVAASDVRAEND